MSAKQSEAPDAGRRRALLGAPADIDAHEADMARRRAEREAKRGVHLDCLDPGIAKEHEDRKPLYEWRVECSIFRKAVGSAPAHLQGYNKNVVAQNEGDAWAMFCDSIQEWPSFRDSKPKITKLKKRSLHASDPGDEG
jgi:hypothetical protein